MVLEPPVSGGCWFDIISGATLASPPLWASIFFFLLGFVMIHAKACLLFTLAALAVPKALHTGTTHMDVPMGVCGLVSV